ncbi:MAG: DAK2 domain-containing protein [Clostridia bacterium]|nr:DAK2 domain-containing protein [Clostridia bacterium]
MSHIQTIDGLLMREMVVAGSALLEANRTEVDALNVFPVPDGDTGTNMSLTMQSAVREISAKEYLRADEACAALSKGALKGARGNSGVITSQLMRGFAKSLGGAETINPVQFARALKAGSDLAYKAVMKPKEGTILTVARVIAEHALQQVEQNPDDFEALFEVMLQTGAEILKKTPDMLPALKQAGVVDSGGKGLLYIYTGYAAIIRGESVEELLKHAAAAGTFVDDHDAIKDLTYIYHIAYDLSSLKEDCGNGDVDFLKRRLNRIGNAVSIQGEDIPYHVHVHTNNPGSALEFGVELGEVTGVEVENIAATRRAKQAAEAPAAEESSEEVDENAERKPYGMVAVSLGDGFSKIFRDLGVDHIVEGGQTMNPSIDDILQAVKHVHAETVYVFPNNGNVILAAQQAAELATETVYVIPTKNVAMGIAAAVAFQPDADGKQNAEHMEEAAQHVKTATITYAVRDSENNGVTIHEGDYIGLSNGKISYAGQDIDETVDELMNSLMTEDDELITVYYGSDVTEETAKKLADRIAENWPDCDVECLAGGQPLYYYLISVE